MGLGKTKMSFDEFMAKFLSIFPDMIIGEDNDGQLIIYTGMKIDDKGRIQRFS